MQFPSSERYGLTSQLRRAAVTVLANIVEGNARVHRREYIHFCHIARASIAELKSLLRLSLDLEFLPEGEYRPLFDRYNHLGALLYAMIKSLSPPTR